VTHAPGSLGDAASLMREFAAHGRTVGVTGGETPGGPARVPVDELLSTRSLDAIVEYVPSDQIVTVQAGLTIARLQAALREQQQRLALDPPLPERTTIGGAVASATYGPMRTRYGTAKDAIVGMTIVRADGTLARGGGKVVKNVAGFDIPKLMIGTYGTLALIGSVTFRVHPLPESSADVLVPGCDAEALRVLCREMTAAQLEPSAIYAIYDGQRYDCSVRLEGFPAGVAAQREKLLAIVRREHRIGDAAAKAHEEARTQGTLQVKLTAPPSMLAQLHTNAVAPLYELLSAGKTVVYPALGVAFVSGDCDDAARVVAVLERARAVAEAAGGALVVLEAPESVRTAFDRWGTPPPAFALMRALKERFDPERRMNPGGFVGGL
jgi:glycolate oxidase FAD binding subunit